MAQRYGGAHSPDAVGRAAGDAGPLANAKVRSGRTRARIMFIPALPLFFMSLGKAPVEMAVDMASAGLLLLGAWLLQEGLKAEDAFHDRKIARRPAIPRKAFAAVLVALGVTGAAMDGLSGLPMVVLYGVIAGVLHVLAFGLDPMRDKGMEGIDTFQTDRVARAVEAAEGHLAEIKDAALRAKDPVVMARVEGFQSAAREMIRTVEDDPRDLTAARKYLGIYLQAVRDATVKFADLFAATGDASARQEYFALLNDLQAGFAEKREKLLRSDRSDLDVEIEVLRDRMARDGIAVRSDQQGTDE